MKIIDKIATTHDFIEDNNPVSNAINNSILTEAQIRCEEPIQFPEKWLRVRSRVTGAVSAYCSYWDINYQELADQGGYKAFRMMWSIGDNQDDQIDDYPEEVISTANNNRDISKLLFNDDFYKIAFRKVIEEVNKLDNQNPESASYLRHKIADWYKFLSQQELDALQNTSQYDYDYCRDYRESQNMKAGGLMVALLNGLNANKPQYKLFEKRLPVLSFRTQIIDDIQDTREDLESNRPSYVIGALNENLAERKSLEQFLITHSNVKKVTPRVFWTYAPNSYSQIKNQFDEYGAMILGNKELKPYVWAGNLLFRFYPVYRDFVFKVDPKKASF